MNKNTTTIKKTLRKGSLHVDEQERKHSWSNRKQ
jgi:hypothetical protein